jgi:membrane protease YdiL (CAAX protease family)
MSKPSPEKTKPAWAWEASLEIGFYTLFLVALLSILLGALLGVLSDELNAQLIGSPVGTTILAISEALLLIPLLFYLGKHNINRIQLGVYVKDWRQGLLDTAFGIIIGLTMIPLSFFASALNGIVLGPQPGSESIEKAFTATSPIEAILLCSSIVFVVAPVEEIIVRGFLQQGFENSFGRGRGLLLASFFFAVMHLNLWSIFPLFSLGIVVGLCYQLRHYRIISPIAAHASYMISLVFSLQL